MTYYCGRQADVEDVQILSIAREEMKKVGGISSIPALTPLTALLRQGHRPLAARVGTMECLICFNYRCVYLTLVGAMIDRVIIAVKVR